jgi:hypothetical protein
MKLDELIEGSEVEIAEWLRDRNLLHECDCGYTVYDEDGVAQAVQEEFGDGRCDEINRWACNLANDYGWLWLDETSEPEHGIYHCQHCAGSEWSLLMDMEKRAEAAGGDDEPSVAKTVKPPSEPCIVYVDESYSEQFPRKADGSMSFAAFIVPESAVEQVRQGVEDIFRNCYRKGSNPKELRYSQISKSGGLLERVGRRVAELIKSIPGCAVLAIYVPRSGLFGEQRRSLQAVGHYESKPPTAEELAAVESTKAVEAAVRTTADHLAHTLIGCVGNYLAARNATGRIVLDPRNKRADAPLVKELEHRLPAIPVNAPLIPHLDAVVSLPPHPNMERLGDRLKIELTGNSHQTPGLQIADFIAGDVRTFFVEVPELLTEATTDSPLVNKRVLFPQLFRTSKLSDVTLTKAKTPGKSALPLYRACLANDLVSCFARNGQLRNIDLKQGSIHDIMD